MKTTDYGKRLKELGTEWGANLIGFCQIDDLVEKFHPEIRETARELPYGISIAIALQKTVLDTIIDRPNDIYKSHYRATNTRLDDISYRMAQTIDNWGFRVLPIPASKVISRYPMIGHVNHREIAYKSGLGWRGKNNLLVNPVYGGRLRLTTILTDLEFPPDDILAYGCGKCRACAENCPVGAIGNSPEDFDLDKCREQVTAFSKKNNFGQLICGLCLNLCPEGTRRTNG